MKNFFLAKNIFKIILLGLGLFWCNQQIARWNEWGINGNSFSTNILLLLITSIFAYYLIQLLLHNEAKRANIQLFFTSVIIVLILIEIILRLLGINLTHNELSGGNYYSGRTVEIDGWYKTYKPNTLTKIDRSPEFIHEAVAYHNGLTDTFTANTNTIKVMALGDSFTEGVGALNKAYSWPKILEKQLKASCNSNIEILNGGVAGSDPVFAYKLFQDRLLPLNPQIVLVCINESDIRDVALKGGMERFHASGRCIYTQRPFAEYVYAVNYFSRLFFNAFFNLNNYFLRPRDYQNATETINQVLLQMKLQENQFHYKTILIMLPTYYELKEGNTYLEQIAQYCNKNDITTFSITNDIVHYTAENKINPSDIYWPIDAHFNQTGYTIVGNILSKKICNTLSAHQHETK
jgi:lysophospholipase L1-like esterase